MKKILLVTGLIFTTMTLVAFQLLEKKFQSAADQIRLQHIHHIALLIERYKEKTGIYPFEIESRKSGLPVEVHLNGKSAIEFNESMEPSSYKLYSHKEFSNKMKSVLGESTCIPLDPQKVPTFGPNWYIYTTKNGEYFLAAHLHSPIQKSRYVEKQGYYKYEVGSVEIPSSKILKFDSSLMSSNFKCPSV